MARKKAAISPAPAPAWGITQEELVCYQIADATSKRHKKDRDALHDGLKERVADGATIEPGRLTALILKSDRAAYEVKAGVVTTLKVVETVPAASVA